MAPTLPPGQLVLCKIGRVGAGCTTALSAHRSVSVCYQERFRLVPLGTSARLFARHTLLGPRLQGGRCPPLTTPYAVHSTRPFERPHRAWSQFRTLPCAAGWCTDDGLRSTASAPTDCRSEVVPRPSAPAHRGQTLRTFGATSVRNLAAGCCTNGGSHSQRPTHTPVPGP